MNHQRLNYLIDQYLNSLATEDELKELNNWYSNINYGDKELDEWIRDEHGMENITNRMFASFKEDLADNRKHEFKIIALRISTIAACLIISLCLFLIFKTSNTHTQIAKRQQATIAPGANVAVLTLANGQRITLNTQPTGRITLQNGVVVSKKRNGLITYLIPNKSSLTADNRYNSIETPRGGQYQVILPDGTNVWLNAASKLTYPTRFNGKERIVKLTGEAYFEVAHNARQPFHVLFGNQDVKVLGTHFNINAYADDAESKTTLLQGSITLTHTDTKHQVLLVPGQQAASVNGNDNIAVSVVNTDQVVSWKNGYFQFDQMNITNIMKVMSRWYNVDVKYAVKPENELFGGTFSRESSMNEILNNIESLGSVRFRIDNRTVIVDSKKGGL